MSREYVRPDINDLFIPPGIVEGLERYLRDRIKPGSALTSILQNDLHTAAMRSDSYTWGSMKSIIWFLERAEMRDAWGSKEKVDAWIADSGESH